MEGTNAAPGIDHQDYETGLTSTDRLELRVWLRLLTCANLVEREVRGRLRAGFDTTLPRFDVLAQLDRAAEGLTMGELSRRLMVTNGNVTGLIDRLVGEGLVERRPAPGDRRARTARLSARGKRAFDAMTPAHHGWIEDLFAGLGRKEITQLHALLGRLKGGLVRVDENHNKRR